jgi:catecholate siderophore receptor
VVDRDLIKSDRWGAALAAGFGLGADTSVTASYLHQYDRRRPDYGVVIVQRPGEVAARPATEYGVGVERSSFLGLRDDRDRSTADILTVRVSRRLGDKVAFTSDTRLGAYSRYFQYSNLDQCNAACTAALFDGDPSTEAFGGMGGGGPYDSDAWGLQNISTLRIDHDLGGFRNQAILGVDLSRQENDKTFLAYTLPAGVSTRPSIPRPIVDPDPAMPAGYAVFRAVPGANLDCTGSGNCRTTVQGASVFTSATGSTLYRSQGESTDLAAFVTDRLWLGEALSLIGSFRLDRYAARLDSLTFGGAGATVKVTPTLASPRLSLVYEPSRTATYYASWGRSQTPQGTSIVGAGTALDIDEKDLEPEDSEIWELGGKLALPGAWLTATASIFRITKDNALQVDPDTGFLQAQSGERQRVQGVELGLTGRVTPAWTVSANYSYLDAQILESFATCRVAGSTAGTPTNIVCPQGVADRTPVLNTVAVGQQATYVPEHAAALYTRYDLSDWIEGLSVGGDLIYQGRLHLGYTARSASFGDPTRLLPQRLAEVPESLTLDAFASYSTGRWRVSLNGYNLTDRLNYGQVFGNRAIPAAGRTVIVSLGASF